MCTTDRDQIKWQNIVIDVQCIYFNAFSTVLSFCFKMFHNWAIEHYLFCLYSAQK